MKNGIDVSQWQGNIDFSQLKTDFVIIRAGYGKSANQIDEYFEHNYERCKHYGIPCGAYWYSYATTTAEAELEAEMCLRALKGKQFEYPIYFDVEESKQFALGKSAVSDIIKAFLRKVEAAGYFVGLYMSASQLTNYVSDDIKQRYAVWVAHYGVNKPSYAGQYQMWQKSSTGICAGISGAVDLNECYVDYPELIKSVGLNGFKAESSPAPAQKKSKYVELVIDGVKYKGTLYEDV